MAEPSHCLGVGRKGTNEDDKVPGSDHDGITMSEYNMLHIHVRLRGAVTMVCDFGRRSPVSGSPLPRCSAVTLAKTLHLRLHCLDPEVNVYLVGE